MESKTKSEQFVENKKKQWQDLHQIIAIINQKGFRVLSKQEVAAFPRLFRLTCADLAEAKTLQLSPDVVEYLNQLVGQAHKVLYSFPPMRTSQVSWFFKCILPRVILKNWGFVLLTAGIFLASYAITFGIVRQNPNYAKIVVQTSVLQQMEASYSAKITEERSLTAKNYMVCFYIQNNISIAFASFAMGILLGIGTIYILIYNGISLGAISGYVIGLGYQKAFFTFVTAHSIFELTGLILAAAAGMRLGYSIIKATRYHRQEWLALQRQNILTLVAASGMMLFLAACIEGLISPSLAPYSFKVGVAIVSLGGMIGYFGIWPCMGSSERKNRAWS